MTEPNPYPGPGGDANPSPQVPGTPLPGTPLPGTPLPGTPYGQQPPQYGQAPYGGGVAAGAPPANSMTSSILATVVSFVLGIGSCLPLFAAIAGIMAIVKASQVNKLWAAGDHAGAQALAADAAKYSKIAWIVLGVAVAVWAIIMITLAVTGNFHVYTDTFND